tara:strand:- start:1 stop:1185 length:1185 start_codon:yes stop_codon:yes gene_type:complete
MTLEHVPQGDTALREFRLPGEELVKARIQEVDNFRKLVRHHLIEGTDYGTIPGTDKPALFKPGAEKVAKLALLADTYEIIAEVRDWDRPLFSFTVKCQLKTIEGPPHVLISEGLGECNSYEAKYRYRRAAPGCPECGQETIIKGKEQYGGGWLCWKNKGGCGAKWPDGAEEIERQEVGKAENEDIFSQVNTFLKMAKKRAMTDATLSAGRLSDIFTQDTEEMPRETSAATASPPVVTVTPREPAKPQEATGGRHAWMVQCPEHKQDWFKGGKMKAFAHKPAEDGGKWCNRDPMIAALAMEQVAEGMETLDWEGHQVRNWLTDAFDAQWTEMPPEQHIEAMEAMAVMVKDKPASEGNEVQPLNASPPQSDEPEPSEPETQEDEVQALFGAPQDEA